MDWSSIIIALCGTVSGGLAYALNYRNNKRIAKAQAQTAEWELYEKRIDELHEAINANNETIKEQGKTISTLNHSLDDKTAQIRKLTDRVWQAERDLNIVNERVTSLTADNGNLLLKVEKYKNWHCRNAGCNGRIPPNPSLAGKTWDNAQTTEEAEEIININVNGK